MTMIFILTNIHITVKNIKISSALKTDNKSDNSEIKECLRQSKIPGAKDKTDFNLS